MVQVRALNEEGEGIFEQVWKSYPNTDPPVHILFDDSLSEVVTFKDGSPREIDAEASFSTGHDLAVLVDDALGIGIEEAREHPGMWSWLALLYYSQLRNQADDGSWPSSKGRDKTGGASIEKFVYDPDASAFRYYRHRVFSRFWLWKEYGEDAMAYLGSSAKGWSEISEQTLSVMHLISSRSIVAAVTQLYYDPAQPLGFKFGAGGKGPGSPRRFRDVFWQFNETYSLRSMDEHQILQLLPDEFSRFMHAEEE
mgnify:CR=1 FL=1